MLVRFVLAVVVSALVPILGLTSCSKDPDAGWMMSAPVIEAGTKTFPLKTANGKTFAKETQLRFTGKPWATLKIASACTSDSKTYEDSFTLTYRETLELKALWPRSLTAKATDLDLAGSKCDFKFLAEGDDHSTQAFEMNKIQLTSFVESEDPLLQRRNLETASKSLSGPLKIEHVAIVAKKEVSLLAAIVEGLTESVGSGESIVTMNCEGSMIDAVEDGQHTIDSLLAKSTFSGTRKCHFLARKPAADTNQFAISANAPIRFTNLQLGIRVSPYSLAIGRLTPLQRIEIANPNPESAEVQISSVVPQMRARFAYRMEGSLFVGPESVAGLKVQVTGANQTANDRFVIPQGGTAVIEILNQLPFVSAFCPGNFAETIGLRWGFESPYSILQMEEGDASGAPIYSGPVITNPYSYPASEIFPAFREQYGPAVPDHVQPGSAQQIPRIPSC